jgi:hypothetical protein
LAIRRAHCNPNAGTSSVLEGHRSDADICGVEGAEGGGTHEDSGDYSAKTSPWGSKSRFLPKIFIEIVPAGEVKSDAIHPGPSPRAICALVFWARAYGFQKNGNSEPRPKPLGQKTRAVATKSQSWQIMEEQPPQRRPRTRLTGRFELTFNLRIENSKSHFMPINCQSRN